MSVQDDKVDKVAGHDRDQKPTEDQQATEKPEPDENAKRKAAEMMTAYEDRPTLVLPGSDRSVTGTAVNDWLDEDGNPKSEVPDDAAKKEQIEKDKALNVELKKAASAENKGETD
jgi:hypothetical protein